MGMFRRFFRQADNDDDTATATSANTEAAIGEEDAAIVQTAPMIHDESIQGVQPQTTVDGATRPLPMESMIASTNDRIRFGQSTDTGMVRSNNQDSAYSFFATSDSVERHPDFGLFVVADGMGGHHDGEKASAITIRVVAEQVAHTIYLPLLSAADESGRPPILEMLTEAIEKANAEVIAGIPEGGTTVTAVAVVGNLAYVGHVGDSRAYLITDEAIEQVTRDHSWIQRMIELQKLTPDEAAEHPQKNVLYRAIGQNESLEVDAITRRLPPKSHLLLCSDGLWNLVENDEIAETVRSAPDNPQEACDKLVALANTRGGTDNITVILLQIPG